MKFVVMTLSFIVISIIIIRLVCRAFDIKIKPLSLILAAILASAMVALSISLGTFLDTGQYVRLGILALLAALLVTAVNEYLIRRDSQPKTWPTGAMPWEDVPEAPVDDADAAAENEAAEAAEAPEATEATEAAEAPEATMGEAVAAESAEEAVETTLEEIGIVAEEPEKPQEPEEPDEEPAPEADEPPVTATPSATETAEVSEAEATLEASPAEGKGSVAELPAEPAAPPLSPEEESAEEEAAATEAGTGDAEASEDVSLDDLLDLAYANKDKQPEKAITAYRQAIRAYPDDPYAPFLVIELAGILKDTARYSEAVDLYRHALSMPLIAGNDSMLGEFKKSLRYMETVHHILSNHQALDTPFPGLSGSLMQEIETAYEASEE